jgi:hypothetical protein
VGRNELTVWIVSRNEDKIWEVSRDEHKVWEVGRDEHILSILDVMFGECQAPCTSNTRMYTEEKIRRIVAATEH